MKRTELFQKNLIKFSNQQKKRVAQAQQKACQKICKDIKRLAPVDTGAYRDDIRVSDTETSNNGGTTSIKTSIFSTMTLGNINHSNTPTLPQWENVPLALIIETGTQPHFITPRNPDGLLRWEDDDGNVHYAKWVLHPGTQPNPHWTKVVTRTRDYYRRMINKTIKGK